MSTTNAIALRLGAALGAALLASACSGETSPVTPLATGTLGAAGGTVSAPGGASVSVPAGATRGAVTVTIAAAAAPSDALGPAFLLGPEGARFDAPVAITLPFSPERLPTGASAVVLTAPAGSTAFTSIGGERADATHLRAVTTHFSVFYVGARSEPRLDAGTPPDVPPALDVPLGNDVTAPSSCGVPMQQATDGQLENGHHRCCVGARPCAPGRGGESEVAMCFAGQNPPPAWWRERYGSRPMPFDTCVLCGVVFDGQYRQPCCPDGACRLSPGSVRTNPRCDAQGYCVAD